MLKFTLVACCCFFATLLPAQTTKSWNISTRHTTPNIDGHLSDSCWLDLPALDAFTTAFPVFGQQPHCPTEVRMFYTETALYVAARCVDPDAAGVRRDGGFRDATPTGDWFRISLDTWNDDQLAFDFSVTAAGVQSDGRQGFGGWDANWWSAVTQEADGWTVEMCIPFSALRFPKSNEHTWGLQCTRYDRSTGQTSTWNPQNPLIQDRVLQFGTLTGLRNIRQVRRRSLSIFSNTELNTVTRPFEMRTLVQTVGVDARIGLNESATLDLTILPPYEQVVDLHGIYIPDRSNTQFDLPEPRQLVAEENDLFQKGGAVDYKPWISGNLLAWRYTPHSDEMIFAASRSAILQATKLSARTRGNWRFGVYNALLGPVKATVRTTSTSESRQETLQALSDYNYLSAEYLLPNNSFIQVSNALLLAGPGATNIFPALNFRLRDRSNHYEIRGNAEMTHLRYRNQNMDGYAYELAVSRVNNRWGWRLHHYANTKNYYPYLLGNAAEQTDFRQTGSVAEINYRDFRPRGGLLNVSAATGTFVQWAADYSTYKGYLFASVGALGRRFRQFTFRTEVIPYDRRLRYEDQGAYLDRTLSPNIAGRIEVSSDMRKRLQCRVQLGGSSGVEGDLPTLEVALEPSWVLNRHLNIRAALRENIEYQRLNLLSAPVPWVFLRYDARSTQGMLEVNWYPAARFHVFGVVSLQSYHIANPETVELLPGGELRPIDAPWTNPYVDYDELSWAAGFQYNFDDISYLRFRHTIRPETTGRNLPQLFNGDRQRPQTELTLICVLSRK